MTFEFFLLGCTGVVVFLHGANYFFRAIFLSSNKNKNAAPSLSFFGFLGW